MPVRIDDPGHDRVAMHVQHLRMCRNPCRTRMHRENAAPFDQDRGIFKRGMASTINDSNMGKRRDRG